MEEIEECIMNNSANQDPKQHAKKKYRGIVQEICSSRNIEKRKYTFKAGGSRCKKFCQKLPKKKSSDRNPTVCNEPDFKNLGKEAEIKIEEWLMECYKRGFYMLNEGLIYTVKTVMEKFSVVKQRQFPFENNSPGKEWISNFKKRHAKAFEKYNESNKSELRSVEENLHEWFIKTETVLNQDDASDSLCDPARIFIMDELILKCDADNQLLFWDKRKTKNETNSKELSFVFAASAKGEIVPPLVTSKGLCNRLSDNWQYESSNDGFINCEIFYNYMVETFHPYVTLKCSFPIVIFVGCDFSYLSLRSCDFCKNKNISLICLPRKSHTIQSINTLFYHEVNENWEDLDLDLNIDQSTFEHHILSILQNSMKEGVMQRQIISRFQMNKIYPFNWQKSKQKPIENISNIHNRNSAIEYMEKKIPKEIVSQFQLCRHHNIPWNGSVHYAALYDLWLSIVNDDEV